MILMPSHLTSSITLILHIRNAFSLTTEPALCRLNTFQVVFLMLLFFVFCLVDILHLSSYFLQILQQSLFILQNEVVIVYQVGKFSGIPIFCCTKN